MRSFSIVFDGETIEEWYWLWQKFHACDRWLAILLINKGMKKNESYSLMYAT